MSITTLITKITSCKKKLETINKSAEIQIADPWVKTHIIAACVLLFTATEALKRDRQREIAKERERQGLPFDFIPRGPGPNIVHHGITPEKC